MNEQSLATLWLWVPGQFITFLQFLGPPIGILIWAFQYHVHHIQEATSLARLLWWLGAFLTISLMFYAFGYSLNATVRPPHARTVKMPPAFVQSDSGSQAPIGGMAQSVIRALSHRHGRLIPSRPMKWPWSKRVGRAPEPETGSRYSAAALDTFLEHARAMATWHEGRIDAFERKASTLLGFVGVILVLLPTLRPSIAGARGYHIREFLVGLAILAVVLLIGAAVSTAMVLMPRAYNVPDLGQLRRQWTAYAGYGKAHLAPEQITAMLVDELVSPANRERSPLETMRDDAENRATWMTWATWLVLSGVVALATLTIP
jgi:hypothetical protein